MKCIEENLKRSSIYPSLLRATGSLPCAVFRAAEGLRPHLLRQICTDTKRTVFAVVSGDLAARRMADACNFDEKLYLPSPAAELSRVETRSADVSALRCEALFQLTRSPRVVFLSAETLLYKMRPKESFEARFITLSQGQTISPSELAELFVRSGFERCALVEAKGQCSGRGEIAEVFAPNLSSPVRITWFDDEIESIKAFDPDTQRSFGKPLESILLAPAREICLSQDDRGTLAGYLEASALKSPAARCLFELNETGVFPNIEAFAGVMPDPVSVTDWCSAPIIVTCELSYIASEYEKRAKSRASLFSEALQSGSAFGCENDIEFGFDEYFSEHSNTLIDLPGVGLYKGLRFPQKLDAPVSTIVGFGGNLPMLKQMISDRADAGWQVYMFAGGRAKQLSSALEKEGISAPVTAGKTLPGISIVSAHIPAGFSIDDTKALYLSEADIFGTRREKGRFAKKSAPKLDLLADLSPGDMVVHEIHGKGRYNGLKTMEVAGVSADYMEIEYRDGDKLYIQTSQIDRVQKYIGPNEERGALSKLGGREWESQKAKARTSVKKLTEDLVVLYEERANIKGFAFAEDDVWQRQFEDNFIYELTPGQAASAEQIRRDMCSEKVMDRLLLGDVGYGKTEVAMRACFRCVNSGKQVAVLVPTTLLARQHMQTFTERFSGFPVRIAMLSRYTKQAVEVIHSIAKGSVDIVIGTHKLLSKSVEFKDLGLLVIDEEQRFGVSHKERMKDMRRSIDVLTLSATPIPRTLEMAMTGIRDMSTIDTPPPDRKEVSAFVAEFSWNLVREAVMKELARGGQTYFVCRQIRQMDELARNIQAIVPEARLGIAHGQMSESVFEREVSDFIDGKYDVLLCTTIIESGIDIPNANTIIVYEAENFGLSQLYQLKGRIGRSAARGYAYFTHHGVDRLSEASAKRLSAIREFTQFGSGFKIAMRDLEIRGAGNLLGAEQSGHMDQIGYHLYCKFIRQEVDAALGHEPPVHIETAVELGRSALIPSGYIPDEAQKLDMYRACAAVSSVAEAKELRDMFTERYGKPPAEVETLITSSLIRCFAARAGIASVIAKPKAFELKFTVNAEMNVQRLMRLIDANKGFASLRPSDPPVILLSKKQGVFNEMLQLLGQIRHCTKRQYQV